MIENLNWAKQNYNEIVITGDFNLPFINWETENSSNAYGQTFIDTLNDNGLEQLIKDPTRYRDGQVPSLLDLIITSDPNVFQSIEIADPFGRCDHASIHFSVLNQKQSEKEVVQKRDLKKMNIVMFERKLNEKNWEEVFEANDINRGYEIFLESVKEAYEESTPIVSNCNLKKKPWMNSFLKKLRRKKREKWDRYRRSNFPEDYEAYKDAVDLFTDEKEKAIINFETKIIASEKSKPKLC